MDRIVLVVLLLALNASCQQAEPPAQTAAVAQPSSEPTINVGGNFEPATVSVPQGQPIRLKFMRGNGPTCADEVVFADLGVRKALPKNETTVVELPAQAAPRTLTFACGMNMMKGSIVVQ